MAERIKNMLGMRRKRQPVISYDPDTQDAVLHCSICTGEQVAGFKDKKTKKFTEVMLIKNPADLDAFMKMYGLSDVRKEY